MKKYFQIDAPWKGDRMINNMDEFDVEILRKALSPSDAEDDSCVATTLKPYLYSVLGGDYRSMARKIQKGD